MSVLVVWGWDGTKADQCSGKGACNTLTGLCSCDKGTRGGSCIEGEGCKDCNYKECEASCNGNNGMCDRISGKCVCMTFRDPENDNAYTGRFNGKVCKEPGRKNKYLADWTRSMDKWGWSVCKKGYLLTGLIVMDWGMLSTTLGTACVSSLPKAQVLSQEESRQTNATMRIGGRSLTQKAANSAVEATLFQGCSGATATLCTASRWPSAAK